MKQYLIITNAQHILIYKSFELMQQHKDEMISEEGFRHSYTIQSAVTALLKTAPKSMKRINVYPEFDDGFRDGQS